MIRQPAEIAGGVLGGSIRAHLSHEVREAQPEVAHNERRRAEAGATTVLVEGARAALQTAAAGQVGERVVGVAVEDGEDGTVQLVEAVGRRQLRRVHIDVTGVCRRVPGRRAGWR